MPDDLSNIRPPTFSQRHGHQPYPPPIQLDGLDERTRTDLWNFILMGFVRVRIYPVGLEQIWMAFFEGYGQHFHENETANRMWDVVTVAPYNVVFDLIEFLTVRAPGRTAAEGFNALFKLNRVGYRVGVDGLIVPITDSHELESIAAAANSYLPEVQTHMRRAVELFADRTTPQFAKSISESMLAAEAAAQKLAGKSGVPLGDAVDELKRNGLLHGALAAGWKSIYGYSSQDGGIRHAIQPGMLDPGQDLAQYFLVTCSAFVNLCESLSPS